MWCNDACRPGGLVRLPVILEVMRVAGHDDLDLSPFFPNALSSAGRHLPMDWITLWSGSWLTTIMPRCGSLKSRITNTTRVTRTMKLTDPDTCAFREAPCFSPIRYAGTAEARSNRTTTDQGSLAWYMARRKALLLVTLFKVFVNETAIGVPAAIASLAMSVMRANLSRQCWVASFS